MNDKIWNWRILCIFLGLTFFIQINFNYEVGDSEYLIKLHNYPFEKHTFLTEDGYRMTIFRIPGRRFAPSLNGQKSEKPPLILQHGILGSSDVFLVNGINSPAFYFADQGYDVWLTNVRGNSYVRENINMETSNPSFWNFSFEEIGLFDSKAHISYILTQTTQEKIDFVGYSQGSLQILAALSLDPFFSEKISSVALWAPALRMDLSNSPLVHLGYYTNIWKILRFTMGEELLPSINVINSLYGTLCDWAPFVCELDMYLTSDSSFDTVNIPQLAEFKAHSMRGMSAQGLETLYTMYGREQFGNNKGKYKVGNIRGVRIGVFFGQEDRLGNKQNVEVFVNDMKLGGGEVHFQGEYPHMGHVSFLIPKQERRQYLYDTLQLFKSKDLKN